MKVLILSDIHFGDYKTYNPEPNFRLNQFYKLTDDVCNVLTKKSIKELWICGDLLQTAQSTPLVMQAVKNFLTKTAKVSTVRLILGNHDVLVRSGKTAVTEYSNYSLISLLDTIDNAFIYYNEIVEISGKRVHFHSWVPSNSFETESADYLICHGDIDKTLSPFSVDFIDPSKYKRVFCGHIHIFKELGNVISVGTPLMHSFSDSPDVGYLIYDLSTDNYERISTVGKFLEFKYAKTEEEALKIQDEVNKSDQDAVVRVKQEKDLTNINITSLSIDPLNALKEYSKNLTENSLKVLNAVISRSNETETDVPDLRVHLKSVQAKNFLSIKDINFNFDKYDGLTTIKGNVGAGKSTLFNLIEFMLFGKLSGYNKADYTSINSKKFSGLLTLEYKGNQYEIKRTLSSLEYTKDGKPQESNKKNDLQKNLEQDLPFLKFWNLIYIKQSSTGIFSDMSDTSRVSFLSNLIGLSTIKTWTELLQSEIKNISNDTAEKKELAVKIETTIQNLTSYNNQNVSHNTFIDPDVIQGKIQHCNDEIQSLNSLQESERSKLAEYNRQITNLQNEKYNNERVRTDVIECFNEIKIYKTQLKTENEKISGISKPEQPEPPVAPEYPKKPAEIDRYTAEIYSAESEIRGLSCKLKEALDTITKINENPDVCPMCGQRWDSAHIESELNRLQSDKVQLTENIAALKQKASELENKKSSYENEYSTVLNAYETKKLQYNSNLKEYNAKIEELNNYYKVINGINTLNENINSATLRIKKRLGELVNCKYSFAPNGDITLEHGQDAEISILNSMITNAENQIMMLTEKVKHCYDELSALNLKLGEVSVNNEIYSNIQANMKTIAEKQKELKSVYDDLKDTDAVVTELQKFNSKVLSDKGLLVASMLQNVANYLNTDKELKVETIEELQNGSLKPTLNIKLYVKEYDKYVDYSMLSGGQRLLADLRFLKGLTNTLGSVSVIFMDETFKFFSTETVFEGVEIIKNMSIDKVFLILHGNDTESLSDKTINVVLNENGSCYL